MLPFATIVVAGYLLSPTTSSIPVAPPAKVRSVLPAIRTEKLKLLIPGKTVSFRAILLGFNNTPLDGRKISFRLMWRAREDGKYTDLFDAVTEAETDEKGIATGSFEVPADLLKRGMNGRAKLRIGFGGDLEASDNIIHRERTILIPLGVAQTAVSGASGASNTESETSGEEAPSGGAGKPPSGTNDTADTPEEKEDAGASSDSSSGANTAGSPSSQISFPSSEKDPPLGVDAALLRTFMGDISGYEDAAVAPEDAKISRSAVPLIHNRFHTSPARFWLDAEIVKIKVSKADPIFGVKIPRSKAEGVVKLHLVDTLTQAEWTWTEATKKESVLDVNDWVPTLKVPKELQALMNPKAALARSLKGYAAEMPQEVSDLDVNTLFPDKRGEVLKSVMAKGSDAVRSRLKALDWMVDILSVRGKNVIINSGNGFPYKVGDTLGVIALEELVKDKQGNAKILLFAPVGKIEIVRIKDAYVVGRIISGEGVESSHYVCSVQTYDRVSAEKVE